jgi:hypothetical protein
MELILFVAVVALVAAVGVGLGLALAPRLAHWDEGRGRSGGDDPVDEGGDDNCD